jgi:hypothetical protein
MLRPIIAVAAAAFLTLTLAASEASARPGFGGGGFRGGGFHGGFGGFRGGGFHRGFGFRHFGPRLAFGAPFLYGAYAGYPYYASYGDDCLAPRRIWTAYGWRIRWVNVCY